MAIDCASSWAESCEFIFDKKPLHKTGQDSFPRHFELYAPYSRLSPACEALVEVHVAPNVVKSSGVVVGAKSGLTVVYFQTENIADQGSMTALLVSHEQQEGLVSGCDASFFEFSGRKVRNSVTIAKDSANMLRASSRGQILKEVILYVFLSLESAKWSIGYT